MPLLKLETTVNLSGQSRTDLLTKLSRIVAETIGKPEKYVMVIVSHSDILMSGQPGHAAFVDLRSIGGLSDDTNRKLTERICDVLEESLAVPPDRVYATFTDVQASNWGWNGATFG
jgi:phenylpyruvate tautomerase